MTAAFLQSALVSLIADSKKKFGDVRDAAEKSLADLKAITVTSEAQLAGDLSRRPDFISAFLQACSTKHAKLVVPATSCLQRLAASHALPNSRLGDVLDACWEAVNLSYEVQLKILQTLPALLQLYSKDVHGQFLARVIDICAALQTSRTTLVANSAGATLDQLVESVFEQAEATLRSMQKRDEMRSSDTDEQAVHDAVRLFKDFSLLLNLEQPEFLSVETLQPLYLLRMLEGVVTNHTAFLRHDEMLVEACCSTVLPATGQLLSGSDDFLVVAHCARLTYSLLLKLAPRTFQAAIPVLKVFLSFTDRGSNQLWKRCLSLELFRNLLTNFGLLLRMYGSLKTDEHDIIASLMAILVRIAVEDPTLIGMGRQSTMPTARGSDADDDGIASIEAQSIGGGGLATVNSADSASAGIGKDFSTMERPLLDAEESTGPSNIPKTYIYTLVLSLISSLCEGLSRFVMPLSMAPRSEETTPSSGDEDTGEDVSQRLPETKSGKKKTRPSSKYQRLTNPLKTQHSPQLEQLQICAAIIDHSWPAILATSSTFLNVALDSHFFHVLIRSMQKLTQVSGTLELSTPRDALLTSLAKSSIPANTASTIAFLQSTAVNEDAADGDESRIRSPQIDGRRQSVDHRKQSLNIRHLLCLRALLNLGIALGFNLGQDAWFIIVETLQQVDALTKVSRTEVATNGGSEDTQNDLTNLGSEITAATTAARRMFESSAGYNDETFVALLKAVFQLLGDAIAVSDNTDESAGQPCKTPNLASPASPRGHRVSRSVSGLWLKTKSMDLEVAFVLLKVKELARVNLPRLTNEAIWDLMTSCLLQISQNPDFAARLRIEASKTLNVVCMEIVKIVTADGPVRSRVLNILAAQVLSCEKQKRPTLVSDREDVLENIFDALEDVLGHCGELLDDSWSTVATILDSGVRQGAMAPTFRCIQLICNDYLSELGAAELHDIIPLLASFAAQQADTNMALTTATLLRNLVSHLQPQETMLDLDGDSKLWFSAIVQLSKLGADHRHDVRGASIRIFTQLLAASAQSMKPESWSLLFQDTFASLVQLHLTKLHQHDEPAWEDTCVHLVQGMAKVISTHGRSMFRGNNGLNVWARVLDTFQELLRQPSLRMYTVTFEVLTDLLRADSVITANRDNYVSEALLIWASHPLTALDQNDDRDMPNDAATASHANFIDAAFSISPAAVTEFVFEAQSMAELLKDFVPRALVNARHQPYTSDLRQMTSEQLALLRCIIILKDALTDVLGFTNFSLNLLESIHEFQVASRSDIDARSKKWQRPTLVAVSRALLTMTHQILSEDKPAILKWDITRALNDLVPIITAKYSTTPSNADAPLWKAATMLAATILGATASNIDAFPSEAVVKVSAPIVTVIQSVLGASHLENSEECLPEALSTDADFDVAHFNIINTSARLLFSQPDVSDLTRKQYILSLLHDSLLAKRWYRDFPADLLNEPLENVNDIRPGSVHDPVFTKRPKVAYAALDALFDLVDQSGTNDGNKYTLARVAMPFVLLRIAHAFKVFLSDQPLRGLTSFPRVQLAELRYIIDKCLKLNCNEAAFAAWRASTSNSDSLGKAGLSLGINAPQGDGKSHLRALYKMLLRLQKGWKGMMRLPKGRAWQDSQDGVGVERGIEMWIELVAEDWGI